MADVPPTVLDLRAGLQPCLARMAPWLHGPQRVILGLVGPPGVGKSTLAAQLCELCGPSAVLLPMDGFHLAQAELVRLGREARKGAPETFDASGFIALLQRLHAQQPGETVYAPTFRREIEEPIAGAIAIEANARLIITEGNYLLLREGPWAGMTGLLDECWYLELNDTLRTERLVARHMRFGRSRAQALAWIAGNDEHNARLIAASRPLADCVLHLEPG